MITGYFKWNFKKKSSLICIVCFFLFILPVFSQNYEFDWATRAGGPLGDRGDDIVVDNFGNVYVTGVYSGTTTIGTTTLSGIGNYDIFIAKFDASGNFIWAVRAGGSDHDYATAIATDISGNVYITGYFWGTAVFGSTTITSVGGCDLFVAKIDPSGNFIWAEDFGGPGQDNGEDIAVDGSGNIFVIGNYWGTYDGNNFRSDVWIFKLDNSGNQKWHVRAGIYDDQFGCGIVLDGTGNILICGHFYNTATFESISLVSAGFKDIFIAKLNSSGRFIWAKRAGGWDDDIATDIDMDGSGNIYITGFSRGNAEFGSLILSGEGDRGYFYVAKLDASGNFIWATRPDESYYSETEAITVDNSGNIYITGGFVGRLVIGSMTYTNSTSLFDSFIAALNSLGDFLWVKKADGADPDFGNGISTDGSGNIFVTGLFRDFISFGSNSITSAGDCDIFIARLTPEGASSPDIASSPVSGSWGSVSVGISSGRTFIISNEGNSDLIASGTYLDGANKVEFNIQSGGGAFTLSPGSVREIHILFTPASVGTKNAVFKIMSNDPNENPYLIPLTGTGSSGAGFAIMVDGNKDSFYGTLTGPGDGYLQIRSYAYNDVGAPANDADLSAKIWTAWDTDWLYIYEEVKDNVLSGNASNGWENDCFELKVDPQATSEEKSTWDTRLTALAMGTAGVVKDDNLNSVGASQKQYVRKTITGGYALEMAVQWSAITTHGETINPAEGNVFGAAIYQQDNDGNAARDATLMWAAVMLDVAWNTPGYMGTVTFLSDHKLKFEAVNVITGTINPIPYDGSDYSRSVNNPDISADPSSGDYGSVNTGSHSDMTFSVSNTGDANLNVTSVTITGANATDFSIQSGGGTFTLAPGAVRDIQVRFSPSTSGNKITSLSITSNDPDEGTFIIQLTGNGVSVPEFAINVDGNKDSYYGTLTGPDDGYLQLRSYAWNDNGVPDNDADLSAKVWTAWDSEWLYIYEEVKDNTLAGNATNVWEEDCFEILVDPQATSAANSVWQGRLTVLTTSTAGVVADDDLDNVSGSDKQVARKTITGGYALELAVKWNVISSGSETITPAAGTVFGAAINQHDNDGSAKRDASVQWAAVLLDATWNTPSYLGTVKFLSDHKLQFIAKNNITNVTNPVPYDGSNYTRTGVEEKGTVGPVSFGLEQNYPNPFNPSTRISFSVDKPGEVNIEIFDLLGRSIRTFGNMQCASGSHAIEWDGMDNSGRSAASGIYLIVLSDGSRTLTKKMIRME